MSETKPAEIKDTTIHPQTNGLQSDEKDDVEWAYSGKAMRAQWILYLVISVALLILAGYLTLGGVVQDNLYTVTWVAAGGLIALIWVCFFMVYIYRTWTLRYKLTDHRLYTYQGFFTKISDSMELVYIEDVQLIVTLWDRLLNGGVGKVVIFSSADKTHEKLVLMGIENPQYIFERIDTARARVRAQRAIISN